MTESATRPGYKRIYRYLAESYILPLLKMKIDTILENEA
jgi:hypothetical protein